MPRKRQESIDASHLLNFRSGVPTDLPSTSYSSESRKAFKKAHKKEEAEWQERKTRERLSSSFFLHASSSHAFVISRKKKARVAGVAGRQDENEADKVVEWDRVRVVKCLVPSTGSGNDSSADSSLTTCAICLNDFVAPRVTTCGHLFCYPCILRHLNCSSGNDSNSTKALMAKCPCCSHLMSQSDLRPVQFISVQSVQKQRGHPRIMEFRKLQRCKNAIAPFVPSVMNAGEKKSWKEPVTIHKRVNKDDLPLSTDKDACFSRFNYLDIAEYKNLLLHDTATLHREMENISLMYSGLYAASCESDKYYVSMALQAVEGEQADAAANEDEEMKIQKGFVNSQKKHTIEVIPFVKELEAKKSPAPDYDEQSQGNKNIKDEENLNTVDDSSRIRPKKTNNCFPPGTMYIDEESYQFYQATDGSLVFLSGFNLNCLSHDFSAKDPVFTAFSDEKRNGDYPGHQIELKAPFPDIIKGQVIDTESVHITPGVRKRMPCFSHLPLYTDVTMVEIDITGKLSERTRQHFKKDMKRRRDKRQAKKESEKKMEREARQKEEQRIEELKKGIQRIDPNDTFFHAASPFNETIPDNVFDPSDYTQDLSTTTPTASTTRVQQQRQISFSSVCTSNGAFPSLNTANETSFPSLSASAPSRPATSESTLSSGAWRSPAQSTNPRVKKGKGKKVVLFSTGGRRSYS